MLKLMYVLSDRQPMKKCSACSDKIAAIVKGYLAVIGTKYFNASDQIASDRYRICRSCSQGTWMAGTEYAAWLFTNGIHVLKNINDLTVLPPLPKRSDGKNLFCRLCKCYIPAKASVEDEKCPLDKWDK